MWSSPTPCTTVMHLLAPEELCSSEILFGWRCRPVTEFGVVIWPLRSAQLALHGVICSAMLCAFLSCRDGDSNT